MTPDQEETLAASGYAPTDITAATYDRRRGGHHRPPRPPSPTWREWLERHARLAGAVVSLGMAIGALVASLGFKVYGPGSRVEQLAARIDSVTMRTAAMERRQDRTDAKMEFLIYMNCIVVRQVNPNATPPECGTIVQARIGP